MDRALDGLSALPPSLGGSLPCRRERGEPTENIHNYPRLIVVLRGSDRHAISVRGNRTNIELLPGQSLYMAPNAWSIHFFSTACWAFGMVVRPQFVRLIQIIIEDPTIPQPREGTPWAYHTALPLSESGMHVARAMNCLAEEGRDEPPVRELFVSLLRLVRRQLAEDVPSQHSHRRAFHTWNAVEQFLAEHYGRNVTRESVAEALDIHPNYLSALARQAGGQSFRRVLENVRMTHARRLLRDTDMKLARIATLCGYANANRFSTVFRRTSGITPSRFRGDTGMRK